MKTGTVSTEGADIVYDYVGNGPVLLTIAGGGGTANRYWPMANLLANEYTVVSYDRRCNGRSTGDNSADLDMAQSARDAAAVIRAMGVEQGYVYGNSGGANIGLKLAEDIPQVITGLIVHEPPVISLLPDADIWETYIKKVHEAYVTQGTHAAMALFLSSLVDCEMPAQGSGTEANQELPMDYFMGKEYVPLGVYVPNLDAIARNQVSIITAAGIRSADAYYARTARLLAEHLDCPYAEFPGNHFGYRMEPQPFAARLREVLHGLSNSPTAI